MEIQRVIQFFYRNANYVAGNHRVSSFFFIIIIRSFLFRPTENQCVLISYYIDSANEQSKRWRETANLKLLDATLS